MRRVDIIAAIVMLALSALVVAGTAHLPYWSTFAPGPSFAAYWVAGAGAVIGLTLLVQGLRRREDEAVDWPDRQGVRQVLLGIAALWGLLVLLPVLGAFMAGIVFMLFFLLVVERRPIVPSLVTTVITVGLFELVFAVWLRVSLPVGPFGI